MRAWLIEREANRRALLRAAVKRAKEKAERDNKHDLHNMLVVKGTVCVGMFALILLPPEHKEWAGLAINLLWLWRT